jgi:hypothetical protein
MGQSFSKAPVTSYFVLGYIIGFPIIYFLPEAYFTSLHPRLFKSFEAAPIHIDPSKHKRQLDDEKVINYLIKLSQDDSDDDKSYMKASAAQRTHELAEREEEWVQSREKNPINEANIEGVINEYEAVKRLNQKQNKL